MNMEHVDPEELGEIESLPESHPKRRHVEECPRCKAALAAYQAFLSPPEGLAASDRAEARTRLTAARAAGGRVGGVRAGAVTAGRRRWWAWPAWRPALALSAAAVVAAVLYVSYSYRGGPQPTSLRGGHEELRGGGAPEILDVARDRDDAFRLRWRAVAGADAYRVTLFAANLEVIGEYEAGADTSFSLGAGGAGATNGSDAVGRALYVQVTALREGEEASTSAMVPVGGRQGG